MTGRRSIHARLLLLAALAQVVAAGCRSGMSGNLAARPDSLAPRPTISAQSAIDRHNSNAELIQALDAKPGIIVSAEGQDVAAKGRMTLERPKNFYLQLGTSLRNFANIGSNDQGFWFWVENKKDPAIYICSYEDLQDTKLTVTMQPDWIIEALGLRPIPPEEAATVAVTPGSRPGTSWLTQRRKGESGEILTKQMLIDDRGQVREHRLYSGNKQTLLSRAVIEEYQEVAIADPSVSSLGERPTVKVHVPYRFRLEWVKEKLALDVTMDGIKVNPKIGDERREALFTEPTIPGTDRVDLAAIAPKQAAQRPAAEGYQRRTSRSAPPAGEIELRDPESMQAEGARNPAADPVALSLDLDAPPAVQGLVRPGIPRPPQ